MLQVLCEDGVDVAVKTELLAVLEQHSSDQLNTKW